MRLLRVPCADSAPICVFWEQLVGSESQPDKRMCVLAVEFGGKTEQIIDLTQDQPAVVFTRKSHVI